MHCVIKDKEFGDIYAFEIDGKGNSLLYDHADMPNLLTAPWYGYCSKDAKVYKNTLEFIYSSRNEGFIGVMDGRFSSLCDGSKTMLDGPWPMSAMGKILAGFGDSENVREMLDLIASSMCDNLLIPEIIDKNSARTRSRRWFAWPPALFVTCFIEGVCGIKALKDSVSIAPVIPDGWESFCSPQIKIKGKTVKVCIDNGKERVFINGHETDKRILKI
jgi:meiotically up-regulated gene 157 (Mug157) protein